jgi:hypothetical protein
MAVQTDFAGSIWLLLMNMQTEIDQFFTDIDVPVDSELFVAHRQEDDVQLTEVYRVRRGYPLQEHAFGTVSARNNELSATDITFYDRRNNLQGLIMEAATTEVGLSQPLHDTVCTYTLQLKAISHPLSFDGTKP